MFIVEKLKVLSLFSGVGAFEKGLENLGVSYNLVGYSEFDSYASKSYSLIHNVSEDLNLGDVTKINEKVLPNFDLMTYGFPCQSFSLAGKKLGFDDPEKGNLFFESMRIVKEKQPKYMIAENVKGLVGHDKGNTLKTILSTLEWLGYNNYYEVLNSSHFNIPQQRERIFIVSIHKDVDKGLFKFPKGQVTKLRVEDFLDNTNERRQMKSSLVEYLNPKYHKEFRSSNGVVKVFDGAAQGYFNSDFAGKRIYSVKGICPTLTTKSDQLFFVELKSRINSRERFRLQGFKDEDYDKIKDTIPESELIKQVGNSITVNVIESILHNLLASQNEL